MFLDQSPEPSGNRAKKYSPGTPFLRSILYQNHNFGVKPPVKQRLSDTGIPLRSASQNGYETQWFSHQNDDFQFLSQKRKCACKHMVLELILWIWGYQPWGPLQVNSFFISQLIINFSGPPERYRKIFSHQRNVFDQSPDSLGI